MIVYYFIGTNFKLFSQVIFSVFQLLIRNFVRSIIFPVPFFLLLWTSSTSSFSLIKISDVLGLSAFSCTDTSSNSPSVQLVLINSCVSFIWSLISPHIYSWSSLKSLSVLFEKVSQCLFLACLTSVLEIFLILFL